MSPVNCCYYWPFGRSFFGLIVSLGIVFNLAAVSHAQTICESYFLNQPAPVFKPTFEGSFLGHGRFKAVFSKQHLPIEVVDRLLPKSLERVSGQTKIIDGEYTHPVLFVFGHNTPKRAMGLPVHNPILDVIPLARHLNPAKSYDEFIVFIPYVKEKGSSEISMYSHRFFLNSRAAEVGGDYYLFPKSQRKIRNNFNTGNYVVANEDASSVAAQIDYSPNHRELSANDQHEISSLFSLFNLPTINVRGSQLAKVFFKAEPTMEPRKLRFSSRIGAEVLGAKTDHESDENNDSAFLVEYNWYISDRY